jgi:hypothetical protein
MLIPTLRYAGTSWAALLFTSLVMPVVLQHTDVLGSSSQEAVTEGGGAQSPPGGDRPDSQQPQLGSGNRGSGQRGSDGTTSVDPGKVRSGATGPGRIVGQVLTIDGDSYVIRDKEGKEITLKTDRHTDMEGMINMGATVEADLAANGHVIRLRRMP